MSWAVVQKLSDSVILAEDARFEERPCVADDFAQIAPLINRIFDELFCEVKCIGQFSVEQLLDDEKSALVSLILACGEHSASRPWTSNFSTECSKKILIEISQNGKVLVSQPMVLKILLNSICPKMAPNLWKSRPALVQCFSWIIFQIKSPTIGTNFPRLFPAVLVILDDWETENKILGCQLMENLVENVTRAELQRNQYDHVIFDILQRLIYEREAKLVRVVVKCLSALVSKVDHRFNQPFEMGRYDEALNVLLGQMELEQGLELRQAYAESLPLYLEAGSICLALWSQKILRIVAEYTTIEDESGGITQKYALEALLIFLKKTWPRASTYASQSLTTVLRLLLAVTKAEPAIKVNQDVKCQILELIRQCLQLISSVAPEMCNELLDGVGKVQANEDFHSVVNSFTDLRL
ncbi:TELO2-interacting protein 2-like [Neocloeon triangulifer]|uniref:TELO2-interacting protein 2-like n=1 Tax=Neocloeon triangulifer TaxID=2078957 RepID=UPI00286F7B29|nr:TELO2-interacting protein 2-like [Neocloeon triangulifer]